MQGSNSLRYNGGDTEATNIMQFTQWHNVFMLLLSLSTP
jgi:hypothetical protein